MAHISDWKPLIDSGRNPGDFMLMYSSRLSDGTRVLSYKNMFSRAYVHLSETNPPVEYGYNDDHELMRVS
jgi:hypothetical protein